MHDDIRVMQPLPKPEKPKPKEEAQGFKTPEEVASKEFSAPDLAIDMSKEDANPAIDQSYMKTKTKRKFWPPTKKQAIIGGAVLIVVVAGAVAAALTLGHHKTQTAEVISKPKVVAPIISKPTTVQSTLSGLPVSPAANQRPITAVMVENTPAARPQSGLSQAGVVFEALTEGGISRFMALYQDQLATNVGPVRSVRPYYISWALGFDAPIAHDGGSPQALSDMNTKNAKNLDEMYNPDSYARSSARPSPHNLYTNIQSLINLEANKGWTSSNFSGWPRKADAPVASPNATSINFNLSYFDYNVHYDYNKATNSYNRSEGGAPQLDANTNKQLSPKVVIGMIVPYSQGPLDTTNAYYSVYQTVGSGQAYVFQDGTLTIGQWQKTSDNAPISFTTASGQPLKLNAGQTWITALASNSAVAYN